MKTMPNWLEKRAYLTPEKEAVITEDGYRMTFNQLRNDAKSVATYLQHSGIQSGDHVAVLAINSYKMIVLIHALQYIGVVNVLLNTRLSEKEWEFQLSDARAKLLIHDPVFKENIKDTVIETIDMTSIPLDANVAENLRTTINQEETSHIIYTSGTTGQPKGVQLSYDNHWSSATASALNLGLHNDDRWLLCLPMFHVGGLSIIYRSVIYGMPIHLFEKFDVEKVHQAIMEENITIISAVSVMAEQMMVRLGDGKYPDSFRCLLLGGGPAYRSLLEKCQGKNVPVFQTYGMTETASQFSTLDESHALQKLGSAGKPLFPGELIIANEGHEVPMGEVGEILVKGPNVTEGYWNRQKANDTSFENDWLHTGDLGYLDEDGFLYVLDRRKDLIISGGENIYPAEIENVLKQHPDIVDAGVVGRNDEKWGHVPVAFVTIKNEALNETDVIEHCHQYLAKYKVPKQIFFKENLPRNAAKKLMRHLLADEVPER
ncbi:o-succinylbenzoate--CoA ligase [Halalkalibacillus sediminis]|uniref:2-succinylbenzoate--CoA ligase n=1 Tax=Halalkalibacillus sediminis TaxID=2018042 RepID=A0A2I0QUX5_9BACI|nr:o-succinylbenzoate--CoA ligase [Halalkalibacillus sediminis]PKR78135.1 o-succinylbenzoate--CoA ligase [Halalkalibacillus sediminis]